VQQFHTEMVDRKPCK